MQNKILFIRSVKAAVVVDLILNLINHYDLFFESELSGERIAKITFTFFVPVFVSMYAGHKAIKTTNHDK